MDVTMIGTVQSPVAEPVDEGWGDVVSTIHVRTEYARGLEGIEGFSHAIVLFMMHHASFDLAGDLVRRPRGRDDMPEAGIFAQRARHRPNPIGVTAVRILERDGNSIRVQGLDAIDGTPVIDIKPYVPVFDRISDATIPEWMERLMPGYF